MAYREVGVIEVVEVLRLWGQGRKYREIARMAGIDRKTARRYVEAAQRVGLKREGLVAGVSEEAVSAVVGAMRPTGPESHGAAWGICEENRETLRGWIEKGLRLTKVRELLRRLTGQEVPYRTLHRYAAKELGFGARRTTVRVDDGKPGDELQVDFGRMGSLWDEKSGRRRRVWALILTACFSRHQFVWLTWRQTVEEVIEGFERAWEFFGGVFRVVIPDNLKAIVVKADALTPRLCDAFLEYAQQRGFVIDPARVRKPDDKPRVERQVSYVRDSFFAGESFRDLAEARERAETWCRCVAGLRVHGTTQKRPAEIFEAEEKGALLPAPQSFYDIPIHAEVTVGVDHHIRVDRALYSVPTAYVGQKVHARADRQLVKISQRGHLIKTHPRQERGGRSTDPGDYPQGKAIYATRNGAALLEQARALGACCGVVAEKVLEGPWPWSRMRNVYRLLSLSRTYGPARVEAACRQALEHDVTDIARIDRMLERALEQPAGGPRGSPPALPAVPFRFQRPAEDFAVARDGPKGDECDEQ